jgi:hypothetical protein
MTVVRKVSRVENDATIEDRKDTSLAPGHLAVPELEIPSVFFFPIPVQVDDHVETAVEL